MPVPSAKKPTKPLVLAVAIIALMLASSAKARADVVTDWNAIAVQVTNTAPLRPGPTSVLDMAIVQIAVYDAIQAYEGDYEPYCASIAGTTGSPVAAAAKAARDILVTRFPVQSAALGVHSTYLAYLASRGLSESDPGVAVGAAAAACILARRANDGSFPSVPVIFTGINQVGFWGFMPSNPPQAMVAPWFGSVTPFTLKSPSQFRPKSPPDLDSPGYTKAYDEVKNLGRLTASTRTAQQTETAIFYNLNFGAVWNRLLREVSTANVNNISDSSRLFALADMAMADSLIAAWDCKSHFVFWRPITAIRYGDLDNNPNTIGDADWLPFITTPPYSDYTSGANNISNSTLRSLALFFGTDQMNFRVVTTNTNLPVPNQVRYYTSFSDAADEVVEARIYQGIHFRFADTEARQQGKRVAQWAHSHFLRPVID